MIINKEKIIILFLCVTIVGLIVFKPSKEVLSEYHISKYKELQQDKESLLKEITELNKDINNLIKQYEEVDSIYNDIDKGGIRERSNRIFRHNLLYNKSSKVSIK